MEMLIRISPLWRNIRCGYLTTPTIIQRNSVVGIPGVLDWNTRHFDQQHQKLVPLIFIGATEELSDPVAKSTEVLGVGHANHLAQFFKAFRAVYVWTIGRILYAPTFSKRSYGLVAVDVSW